MANKPTPFADYYKRSPEPEPAVDFLKSLEQEFSVPGDGVPEPEFKEPGYLGTIDYRIRQLSYSGLLLLHSCPRKFQLHRLKFTARTEEDSKTTITFAYGHVVGEAIQAALAGESEEAIIFKMFLGWHTELFAEDEKQKKSFFSAVLALQKFISLRASGMLENWEIVSYQGRPACELSFSISLPEGFRFRGFVDAVLRHKLTGKVAVLELKTTSSYAVDPATYKNSAQAIGYSVVLDAIFPELSSYEVIYLIYQTKTREFNQINFPKSFSQRALWIRELLLDVESIKMYEAAEIYPMRGESCLNFGRPCQYFNTCTLGTSLMTKPCTKEEEDKTEYQVALSLEELLDAQLAKIS